MVVGFGRYVVVARRVVVVIGRVGAVVRLVVVVGGGRVVGTL